MVDMENEAGNSNEIEIEPTMVEPLEEEAEMAVGEAEEEAEGATTTTTMVEEGMTTTMKADVVEATTTDIRTTSIMGSNNTPSRTSSNKYL